MAARSRKSVRAGRAGSQDIDRLYVIEKGGSPDGDKSDMFSGIVHY